MNVSLAPSKGKEECPVKRGEKCLYTNKELCPYKKQEKAINLREKVVYLIGTVHVSKESARRVEDVIRTVLPNLVCLELDVQRFKNMQEIFEVTKSAPVGSGEGGHFPYSSNRPPLIGRPLATVPAQDAAIKKPSIPAQDTTIPTNAPTRDTAIPTNVLNRDTTTQITTPTQDAPITSPNTPIITTTPTSTAASISIPEMLTLPGILRWLQQQIGEEFGVMPGSEMVAAYQTARKYNLDIALIDRPINITLSRMWGGMRFGEKVKLMGYLGVASALLFLRPLFGKKSLGLMSMLSETKTLDMEKLERGEGVESLMVELEKQFPSLHRALVEERNMYMCNNILHILRERADTLVVVVGMGHTTGMKALLEMQGVKVRV